MKRPAKKPGETFGLSEEQNRKLDFFISAPLRSVNRLIKELYADDHFYGTATYAWVSPQDAKKLFLFGVCKEVIKICIEMMQNKEFLQEVPSIKKKETIEKIIYGSITDGQSYRLRKMIELLSLLILFYRNTMRDEEYRIYLSAENLDIFLSRQKEFKDFYDGEIVSNTQSSIDDFARRIDNDLKAIGKGDLWFLNVSKLRKQEPSIFATKRKIYLDALLVATDDERLALGISYHRTYSRLSLSTHPLLGSHDYGDEENNYRSIIKNITFLSIVCMHIMHKAYKIAGIEDPEGLEKIMGPHFEKSEASKSISAMKKEYDNGDIILTAWTDLAEVIGKRDSKYGYKAYRVKYISRAPLPEYPEDWLESQHILTRLIRRSAIRSFYEKATSTVEDRKIREIMNEVLKQPDNQLLEYAKKTFFSLHEEGLLIPMLIKAGHLKRREEDIL